MSEAPRPDSNQEWVDRFYMSNDPCCAGCDHWEHHSALVGDCKRSAPVSGIERVSMLRITRISLPPKSGHIMTRREHHCAEFKDTFDWKTLPLHYLRRIGYQDQKGKQ